MYGFKRGHSTLMPVLLLNDLIKYYREWFVFFLDASVGCLPDSPKPVSPKLGFRVRVRLRLRLGVRV